MFLAFSTFVLCNRPVFSVPGLGVSPIYATITDSTKFPKCNSSFAQTKTRVWPIHDQENADCISELLDTVYHKDTDTFTHPEGVIIETDPIQIDNTSKFLQGLDNTYNVPYDWLLYYHGTPLIFKELKEKIEEEVKKSKLKASILGYSLGGNFVRYFTTVYNTQEWVKEYIDSVQFLAPGIEGTFTSVIFVSTGNITFMHQAGDYIKHMPSQWAMFPNYPLNKECIERNGTKLDADQIYDEMVAAGIVDETMEAIYAKTRVFLEENIRSPGVKTQIIYNSGIPSQCGVKIIGEGQYEKIICPGDGNLESKGCEYACSHWSNIKCHDYAMNDPAYNHGGIGNQNLTAELVRKMVLEEDGSDNDDGGWFKGAARIGVIAASVVVVVIIIIGIIVYFVMKKKKSTYTNLKGNLYSE